MAATSTSSAPSPPARSATTAATTSSSITGTSTATAASAIQMFHVEGANNVVVRNSEIQDNTDNSMIWISGSNYTFENNMIHDAGLRSGSGAHTECMYVWEVTNLTLKRNHFYRCAIMDVFITGGSRLQRRLHREQRLRDPDTSASARACLPLPQWRRPDPRSQQLGLPLQHVRRPAQHRAARAPSARAV